MLGALVGNLGIELGRGRNDLGTDDYPSETAVRSVYLGRLLDTCDWFDVPASLEVVGHLFLTGCEDHDASDYPSG